jgi:hypothetical protein
MRWIPRDPTSVRGEKPWPFAGTSPVRPGGARIRPDESLNPSKSACSGNLQSSDKCKYLDGATQLGYGADVTKGDRRAGIRALERWRTGCCRVSRDSRGRLAEADGNICKLSKGLAVIDWWTRWPSVA